MFFRFFGPLNDHLPYDKRQVQFSYPFFGRQSVKDAIESLGIPHLEVNLLRVNGDFKTFSYLLEPEDYITVYPHFQNTAPDSRYVLQPDPPDPMRFLLDAHLGKLSKLLRMLGFDTLYRNDYSDNELSYLSRAESRVLLSRDRKLLMRNEVQYGYFVRNTSPNKQAAEVLIRYNLFQKISPFSLCLVCNTALIPVTKDNVESRIPPDIRSNYDVFVQCPACMRVYWKGSHYDNMQQVIDELRQLPGAFRSKS